MTVQQCYQAMGSDYEDVMSRLRTDERVKKFLLKVPGDSSYALLCSSLEQKDIPEAFRAAHTIKGITQNLSLTKLYASSAQLCDVLRDRQEYGEDIQPAFEAVEKDYEFTLSCIQQLAESV